MNSAATNQAKTKATIRTLEKFERVVLDCDGKQAECSVQTAIAELKRTKRTLDDVQLMDFDQVYRADHPRSRQCQAVVDALLSAGLPDPVMTAAAAPSV
jgi:hypothetical protein